VKSTSDVLHEDYPRDAHKVANRGANTTHFNLRDGLKTLDPSVHSTSMATIAPPLSAKSLENGHSQDPNHVEVLKQLEKITASTHFRNSKRYPAFLKFVVEHTLAGRTDVLKERTIGIEVFGRLSDYDTNTDPVVRVTAGEIRKRITQYYRADEHGHELRIELLVGSYVPRFSPSSGMPGILESSLDQAEAVEHAPDLHEELTAAASLTEEDWLSCDEPHFPSGKTVERPRFTLSSTVILLFLGLVVAAVAFAVHPWIARPSQKGVASFWAPFLATDGPALIVIGVHSLDSSGKDLSPGTHVGSPPWDQQSMLSSMIRSDMVPVSDIVSYSKLTKLLTELGHMYRTQGSEDTTFSQLQQGPVILIGGFDNVWTLRMASTLRYRFENPKALVGTIVDSEHTATNWSFDNGQSSVSDSRDYAIVASLFDPRIQQRVLIAAGIGKSGTAAAAEFLTSNRYLGAWLLQAKPSKGKNLEIVLSTEIVEGQQGPPQVIASYAW
jgi:hypothetical protein